MLTAIESRVKEGNLTEARKMLKGITTRDLRAFTEKEQIKWAELQRRTGSPKTAYPMLRKLIAVSGKRVRQPLPEARIEFGSVCLIYSMLSDARRSLKDLNHPDAKRVLGLSYLYDYQLQEAEDRLQECIHYSIEKYQPYTVAVMRVNLCLAMLDRVTTPNRKKLFLERLHQARETAKQFNAKILIEALQSIELQFIFYSSSAEFPSDLPPDLPDAEPFVRLMLKQTWIWINFRFGKINQDKLIQQYTHIRNEAWNLDQFEVVRVMDENFAIKLNQESLAKDIITATRFRAFKNRMLKKFSNLLDSLNQVRIFDRSSVDIPSQWVSFRYEDLKISLQIRLVLSSLVEEQYTPLSVNQLWEAAHPDQWFHEIYSRDCVHQWITRLKKVLNKNQSGLKIEFKQSGYRLVPKNKNIGVIINLVSSRATRAQIWIEELLMRITQEQFNGVLSLKKIEALQKNEPKPIPRRTLQHYLNLAVKSGHLSRRGRGRGVYYCQK